MAVEAERLAIAAAFYQNRLRFSVSVGYSTESTELRSWGQVTLGHTIRLLGLVGLCALLCSGHRGMLVG